MIKKTIIQVSTVDDDSFKDLSINIISFGELNSRAVDDVLAEVKRSHGFESVVLENFSVERIMKEQTIEEASLAMHTHDQFARIDHHLKHNLAVMNAAATAMPLQVYILYRGC